MGCRRSMVLYRIPGPGNRELLLHELRDEDTDEPVWDDEGLLDHLWRSPQQYPTQVLVVLLP